MNQKVLHGTFEGISTASAFLMSIKYKQDVSRFAVTDVLGERGARFVLLQEHDGSRGPRLDLPQ